MLHDRNNQLNVFATEFAAEERKRETEREIDKGQTRGERGRKLISNKPGRPPAIVVARNGPGYRKSLGPGKL